MADVAATRVRVPTGIGTVRLIIRVLLSARLQSHRAYDQCCCFLAARTTAALATGRPSPRASPLRLPLAQGVLFLVAARKQPHKAGILVGRPAFGTQGGKRDGTRNEESPRVSSRPLRQALRLTSHALGSYPGSVGRQGHALDAAWSVRRFTHWWTLWPVLEPLMPQTLTARRQPAPSRRASLWMPPAARDLCGRATAHNVLLIRPLAQR